MELIHLFDKLAKVKAFVFDVDGVFTNNTLLVTEAGELLRTMNARDGLAVKLAVRAGFEVAIITGGKSAGVTRRLKDLGISQIYSGVADKMLPFNDFLDHQNLTPADVLYMGDDLPDLPILKRVGVGAAPADAIPEILEMVDYVSPLAGGAGCVRDIVEKTLKIQQKWDAALVMSQANLQVGG